MKEPRKLKKEREKKERKKERKREKDYARNPRPEITKRPASEKAKFLPLRPSVKESLIYRIITYHHQIQYYAHSGAQRHRDPLDFRFLSTKGTKCQYVQ